jgi:trehalose 6-phosphate synthase
LGSDVLAFQTRTSLQNFARAARKFGGAETVTRSELSWRGRTIRLQRAPIAIDTAQFETLARSERVRKRASELRKEVGDATHVILGVDRLDYTKGIDLRLKAFAGLLEKTIDEPRKYAFVQVAVPSREDVPAYQDLRTEIEQLVGRINGDFGQLGWAPVSYMYRSIDFEELIACYVAADVMLVTPLRDGMNLVAKEYVACRVDDPGVLILSEFAGASEQLRSALIVNPHDVDSVTDTLLYATEIGRPEARRRMRRLRNVVRAETVFEWARDCLVALEDL